MSLSKDLLDILACPQCKGQIDYRIEQQDLTCSSCALVYPVRDGIPVMLVEEASPLNDPPEQSL
jgi:uncharacterized protein YbaR (Trm112 family)